MPAIVPSNAGQRQRWSEQNAAQMERSFPFWWWVKAMSAKLDALKGHAFATIGASVVSVSLTAFGLSNAIGFMGGIRNPISGSSGFVTVVICAVAFTVLLIVIDMWLERRYLPPDFKEDDGPQIVLLLFFVVPVILYRLEPWIIIGTLAAWGISIPLSRWLAGSWAMAVKVVGGGIAASFLYAAALSLIALAVLFASGGSLKPGETAEQINKIENALRQNYVPPVQPTLGFVPGTNGRVVDDFPMIFPELGSGAREAVLSYCRTRTMPALPTGLIPIPLNAQQQGAILAEIKKRLDDQCERMGPQPSPGPQNAPGPGQSTTPPAFQNPSVAATVVPKPTPTLCPKGYINGPRGCSSNK